ncbi:30S ribosomal protein S6 [Candidatus Omnitrophota bacterium]
MQSYEAMFIFNPSLSEPDQKLLAESLEKVLKDNQAEVKASQVFGRRQLAYEIKKCKEGLYYLINFLAPTGDAVTKLKQACQIDENVLRVLVLNKQLGGGVNG